jgi:sec-independent protein translocase protein TatB
VFGLSFGEIVVLLIVGIVVLGPRRLPEMMRTAGQWVAKLRRLSTDLRAQSGIDDLIRQENLESEIQELRSLSRINVIDTLITPSAAAGAASQRATVNAPPRLEAKVTTPAPPKPQPLRQREYPVIGCDAYGALADDVPPPAPPPPPPATPVEAAKPEEIAKPEEAAKPATADPVIEIGQTTEIELPVEGAPERANEGA